MPKVIFQIYIKLVRVCSVMKHFLPFLSSFSTRYHRDMSPGGGNVVHPLRHQLDISNPQLSLGCGRGGSPGVWPGVCPGVCEGVWPGVCEGVLLNERLADLGLELAELRVDWKQAKTRSVLRRGDTSP